MFERAIRVAAALLLLAGTAAAGRHPQVLDPRRARELKDKYLAMTDGWVKAATFTAAERAAMEAGRRWEAAMTAGPDDPLAKKILAAGEPSFEALARIYPGKILDRTVLGSWSDPRSGSSGYDDEFTIWWNGAIGADLFKGPLTDRLGHTGIQPLAHNTTILFRVGADREMYGAVGESFSRIGYEDGWLPIVISTYERGGLRYRQTAFAGRPPRETGGWDVAYVRFEITNPGKIARDAELSADIVLIDGARARGERGRVLDANGAVLMVHAGEFDEAAQGVTRKVRLAPGQTAAVVFKIPYIPDSTHALSPATERDFETAHTRARDFWRGLIASGAGIRTPEARVNNVWRALLAQNFVLADGPRFTYGSGLRYNDSTYPQESNFGAHTFAMYGHTDYAGALQHYFVPISVDRDKAGRKYQNRRAMALHHLLENWRLTGRTDVFERFRGDFYRVAEEIVSERRSTMVETGGERPLHWGLLPPDKPGVDIQASTQRVYVLGHNITNCQGLQDFGLFLVRSGIDPRRGERYLGEAKEFRAALMRAMERAAIRLPGRPPFVDLQTLYFRDTPDYGPEPYDDLALGRLQGTYFHYWVDMALHYNFFHPDDAVAQWLTDYVQQRNGFVLGLTRAAPNPKRDPYGWINNVYDGGYYNHRLRQGRIDEFLLGFYSRLALGMSRHVYAAAEGAPFIGYNTRDGGLVGADYSFPNSAANADTLLMLRNLLVMEELKDNVETGALWVLKGAPRRWFADGLRIEAANLATYFGDIAFSVESRAGEKKILASIRPPRGPWRTLLVSLRHPAGAPIRQALVNGVPHKDCDARAGVVRLAAGPPRFLVEARY